MLLEVYSSAWFKARSEGKPPDVRRALAQDARLKRLSCISLFGGSLRWAEEEGPKNHPAVKAVLFNSAT